MRKVLFLVGPHASGKTYSSKEYTTKHENVAMIDTGPIMRRMHKSMDPDISIGNWVKKMEAQYGKNITSQLISTEIGKIMFNSECEKFILIGFRSLDGINYTVEHLNLEEYGILYVDASDELLYENYITREKSDISFDKFKLYLKDELNGGLATIKEIALYDDSIDYYYRATNDDNFEEKINMHLNNDKTKKLRRNDKNEK